MTTFLDTSVLISALNEDEVHHDWSISQIEKRREVGPLIIPDIVYSEFSIGMSSREETDIAIIEWALERYSGSDDALYLAGQVYAAYKRKPRGRNEFPKLNVLPDFLIGAVASTEGVPLLTTNQDDFLKMFPNLEVISP